MTNVEFLFMCFLAIRISYLEKWLFKNVACFLTDLFVFLLLNCKCSLYVLDMSPLKNK